MSDDDKSLEDGGDPPAGDTPPDEDKPLPDDEYESEAKNNTSDVSPPETFSYEETSSCFPSPTDPPKARRKKLKRLLFGFMVFSTLYAVGTMVVAVLAWIELADATSEVIGILRNWKLQPIIDLQAVSVGQNCTGEGYELARSSWGKYLAKDVSKGLGGKAWRGYQGVGATCECWNARPVTVTREVCDRRRLEQADEGRGAKAVEGGAGESGMGVPAALLGQHEDHTEKRRSEKRVGGHGLVENEDSDSPRAEDLSNLSRRGASPRQLTTSSSSSSSDSSSTQSCRTETTQETYYWHYRINKGTCSSLQTTHGCHDFAARVPSADVYVTHNKLLCVKRGGKTPMEQSLQTADSAEGVSSSCPSDAAVDCRDGKQEDGR